METGYGRNPTADGRKFSCFSALLLQYATTGSFLKYLPTCRYHKKNSIKPLCLLQNATVGQWRHSILSYIYYM